MEKYIPYSGGQDSSSFFYLAQTTRGELFGVNRNGVYFIDTFSKQFHRIVSTSQVSELRNIHVEDSGFIWITTYGKGIFVYNLKEKKLYKLLVDDNGYLLYSHAFIDDGLNNFIVSANKGLFRLNKTNLLKICADPSTPLFYQYFNVNDGLPTNEFNGGCQPAFNRLPNGDLLLPALQGLVSVKVSELPAPQAYPLFIDAIKTKNKKHEAAPDLQFDKDERTLTWLLNFGEWDQTNGQNIFYRTDNASSWQRLPVGERNIQLDELQVVSICLK